MAKGEPVFNGRAGGNGIDMLRPGGKKREMEGGRLRTDRIQKMLKKPFKSGKLGVVLASRRYQERRQKRGESRGMQKNTLLRRAQGKRVEEEGE